jgi:hypothetical protein
MHDTITASALTLAALSFLLSATAGLGGSLVLVPAMSLLLGPKEGVALASLLLACHNVAKVTVFRRTIPLRTVAGVVVLTVIGAAAGASLMRAAPEDWVGATVVMSVAAAFAAERFGQYRLRRTPALLCSLLAGTLSGFSGTSGPLKGIALRSFALDRLHLVGAASAVSLAGDLTKTAIFLEGSLLSGTSWGIVLWTLPLMPLAALAGRRLARRIGEVGYSILFWLVMAGYSARLLLR